MPPCLPQFIVPHCRARLCCGDSVTSYLCPNPSPCPQAPCYKQGIAGGNRHEHHGLWRHRISPGDTAGMTSCSMCSGGVTAATSPCSWGPRCMERAGWLLTVVRRPLSCPRVMLRESWAVGPAGVSRWLPLHHLSLQGHPQGMHQLGAPQHSPACPAPSQHGSLLAEMELGRGAGGGSRALLLQPRQNQVEAIIPPRELWRPQAVAPG